VNYSYDSVRAKIRNISKETGIKAAVLYNRYLLERFIARVAASEHRDKIIIKGGMLISAITGFNMRSTNDLDATIRDYGAVNNVGAIINDIIGIDLNDHIHFILVRFEETVYDSNFPCFRTHLRARFGTMDAKAEIDITTGDAITPGEMTFGFPALLGDDTIPVLAYTPETVLAEKMTAILDLSVINTRAKDFYDVYLLTSAHIQKVDRAILKEAFANTIKRRNKERLMGDCKNIINQVINSFDIQNQWKKYKHEYNFAAGIDFAQITNALLIAFDWAGIDVK